MTDQLVAELESPPPERTRFARILRHRQTSRIASIVALGLALYVLVPQLTHAGATLRAIRFAEWPWVAGAVVATTATYFFAAVSLIGAAGPSLSVSTTWFVQIAAAFTNRIAPAGIGGMATNLRYLERRGASRAGASAAIGLNSLAGFAVHAVALVIAVLATGPHRVSFHLLPSDRDLPHYWIEVVVGLFFVTAIGVARWRGRLRRFIPPAFKDALRSARDSVRHPASFAMLIGGSFGITAGYFVALALCAQAFDTPVPVTAIAVIYLTGSAVASVAPTPGGLGALEAALFIGLTASGMHANTALAAILLYRFVTYWLPILPGALVYAALRRRHVV